MVLYFLQNLDSHVSYLDFDPPSTSRTQIFFKKSLEKCLIGIFFPQQIEG